jgi:hypothetical protein
MIPTFTVGDPTPVRNPFETARIREALIEADPPGLDDGATEEHPFQVVDVSTDQNPRRVRVVPGLLNSIVPQIFNQTTTVDMDTIPSPTVDLSQNATLTLWLQVDTNTLGVPQSAVLRFYSSDPNDSGATRAYQRIAAVTTSDGIDNITPYVKTSLGYRRCRTADHVFWTL